MPVTITARMRGIGAALPTPYRFGRVDLDAFARLCDRLIERGVSALVPCGTTGESPLLTAAEHREVVAATVVTPMEQQINGVENAIYMASN